MYGSRAVSQVKEDFLNTLEQCHQILPEECKRNFLRVFAPLM